MPLTYQEALDFLFPRVTTIKFGLETTEALLDVVGRPHELFPMVHVGGTNGKGSVATLVAAALREAGWRVGLYTSPHLVSFRERIRVGGVPISEEAVAMWTEQLQPALLARGGTFFEATTAMALADFAARGVEIGVVEVGLGGRLDSTNVIRPLVSAVTKIDFDHMKFLGDTLELIAREKAGIAKPGAPFVIGETRPEVVASMRRDAAGFMRALDPAAEPDIRVVPADERWDGPLGLLGGFQRRNAAVARHVLEALPAPWRPAPEAIAAGFAEARIPGRLDRRGRWLFDVAHNPDGMRALVRELDGLDLPGPVHALVSILGDKPFPEMLGILGSAVDRVILTVAPTALGRRWDLDWLTGWLESPECRGSRARWELQPDLRFAIAEAQVDAGTVLVTGSFHTVGDVMAALGMAP